MNIPSNDERSQFYAAMFPLLSKISMGRIIAGLSPTYGAIEDAAKATNDFSGALCEELAKEIAARMRGEQQ